MNGISASFSEELLSFPEYDFDGLSSPKISEFMGFKTGTIKCLPNFRQSVPLIEKSIIALLGLPFLNPWKGKYFERGTGANVWLVSNPLLQFGSYTIEQGETWNGKSKCIRLDYDVPANPFFLKPVIGECKTTSDGSFLGRMLYRRNDKSPLTILYFGLEKL